MKILTIDLDFLFPEMEKIYKDEEFNNSNEEMLNLHSFDFIESIMKNKNYKKIKFINNHNEVLEDLNADEIEEIYNIDHHHDIYYSDEQKSAIEINEFELLDQEDKEACWFYYLYFKNNNIKYNWIGNKESEIVNSTLKYGFKFFLEEGPTLDPFFILNEIKKINFDIIFICSSPNYISKKQIDFCLKNIKEWIE